MTTNEQFNSLKERVFPQVDVGRVVNMSDEEQRDFQLEQVERLLSEHQYETVEWLVREFWLEDQDWAMNPKNPLHDPQLRDLMDDDERILCAFYVSISDFCRSLLFYEPFDPYTIGVMGDGEFLVDNKPLVDFVLHSKYENIDAFIAHAMRKAVLGMMADNGYQPAYDYLENIQDGKGVAVTDPVHSDMPLRDYVRIVVEALQTVEHHLEEGSAKGMSIEEIFLHDEIHGRFKRHFEPAVVTIARQMGDYMERHLLGLHHQCPNEKVWKSRKREAWDNFMDEISTIRSQNFGNGWLADGSKSLAYLKSHAERLMEEQLD